MKILSLFILLYTSSASALIDKSKIVPPTPPEQIIESTKEKSKVKTIDFGIETVLNHREPMAFLDGRVIEVHYFSHKLVKPDEARRASVGLKITGGDPDPEILVLNQEVDREGKETLYGADTQGYSIKLINIKYDESITIIVNPK